MDESGDHLLARARFAVDMHRCLGARDLSNLGAKIVNGLGAAHQGGFSFVARGLVGFQGMSHQLPEFFQCQWFGNKIKSPQFQRLDGALDAAVGRDHGHRHLRIILLHVLYEGQAIAVGQPHVGEAQVWNLLLQCRPGRCETAHRAGLEFHAPQGDFQQFQDVRFVIHQQYVGLRHGVTGSLLTVTRKALSSSRVRL